MIRNVNKKIIGSFVMGAALLFIFALVVFGSGKLFRKTKKFVLIFEGSIRGLTVGAPVYFKGVHVGSVEEIRLVYSDQGNSVFIPVIIEINPGLIVGVGALPHQKSFNMLIESGLRARLELQSFVTGQLAVGLDFFPDKPGRLLCLIKDCPEIPTIPATIAEFEKTVSGIPIKEMLERLDSAIQGVARLVNSAEFIESVRSVNIVLRDMRELSAFQMFELNKVLKEVNRAARATGILVEYLQQHPEALLKGKEKEAKTYKAE
jgi:paraquat-inducible protein B